MSPEHFSNQPITPRSDIFAVGMLLYEMVTGSPAYTGSDSYTVMYKIANQPIVPPSRLRDGLPTALERIILKALAKEPEQRYADAGEMAQALEQFTADGEEKGEPGSGGTLDFLLRRMRHKKDFPAMSRHIIEINNKSSDKSQSSASALSNTILKDYSLTTKLLRLVNSSYYGQYGGRISTVSRAVVILGFEQVRMAALSLILFEHLQDSESASALKDYAVGSMVSGLLARDIASEAMPVEPEEAFICAMFHKLGRQLALYYFPEEYEIIQSKLHSGKLEEEVAAKSVLGVTYEEIGIGVAEYWKFPEKVVNSMRSIPAGKVERPGGALEVLRTVSVFSNELQQVIGIDEDELRATGLKALLKRHDVSIPMGKQRVDKLIERTAAQIVENAELFGVSGRNSALVNRLNDWNKNERKAPAVAADIDTGANSLAQMADAGEGQDQASIFINGIQDVTNAMMDETPLNDILVMVMETMYRGVGFNRTMLCIANPKTKQVQARFGFGADIDELLGRFAFKLDNPSDPFVTAMLENRDELFDANAKKGTKSPVLPEWHEKLMTPARVLLLPIVVNKRPLGLFYADYQSAQRQLTTQQLNFLRTLRNQAILAVKQGAR
jgi:HD-like signal output (HDOD) protein